MTMLTSSRTASLPALKPLYAQVREQLMARVRGGEWRAGESLPNEYVLSTEFAVSIGTIRRAVADLETSGVLVRKQGRGTYVSGQGTAALQEKFCSLRTPAGARLAPAFELISLTRRPAGPHEQSALGLADTQGVFEIVQRLESAGVPIGIERSVFPALSLPRLETQLHFGQHLYPVLADYGLLVTRVDDTIGIEPADAALAGQLACEVDLPLLAVTRLAFTLDGVPIELRSARYLPDRVRYIGAARMV